MGERALQSSFNAGEIAPIARDRVDLDAYFQGAEIIDNMFPLVEGALRRRPGFEFAAELKSSASPARLIAFAKSNEDAVLIEVGPSYFRYYSGNDMAPILSAGSPVETATPYDATLIGQLYWTQAADVMFITTLDASKQPRALARFSDTNWSLSAFEAVNGPFLARNETPHTLRASAVSGSGVTVTASTPLFSAGHVGARFRMFEPSLGLPYDKWLPKTAVTLNEKREYAGNIYSSLNTETTSDQPPVHEDGIVPDRNAVSGGAVVNWKYLHDLSGSFKITAVVNAQIATVTIEEELTHASPEAAAPTRKWEEGAFSDVQGWPRLVGFYESRMFFASTKTQPDTIFGSRTDGFTPTSADFKQSRGNDTVEDDHAIVRTLNDAKVNVPAWMIVDEQLILGTARGLVRIAGPSVDEPITPAGSTARRIPGTKPAGKGVRPVVADDAIIYVSPAGRRLYEYLQGNPVRTLNARASHVGGAPIVRIAWCGEPYARCYALDAAGRLWCLVYERTEGVIAWSRITPGGRFGEGPAIVESIESVNDAAGNERLAVIIKRTINGATFRSIERLALDFDADIMQADEACLVDAARRYDRWNKTATTVTITATAGASRGDACSGAASSGAPFAGMAGEELHIRKFAPPLSADDVTGVLRVQIVTITGGGTGFTGVLLSDPDENETLINSAREQWGFAISTLTGLDHLEGEEAGVQADGVDYGLFTVSGGAIVLPEKIMAGYAGLVAPFRVRSLPVLRQIEGGTSRGRKIAMTRASASLFRTGDDTASLRVIEDGFARIGDALSGRTDNDIVSAATPYRDIVAHTDLLTLGGDEVQLELYGGGVLPVTLRSMAVQYENET